ncbi:MAG: ribosome assembly factor SBDS [Candidatus Aenigmatarchaeota archaeon]
MVTVDEAVIAKYEKDGKHFEILVDPELAYELKDGKSVSIQKMLAINAIFTDARKGDRPSNADILKIFGTNDIEKISEFIIKNGEVQLTTEFRRKKIDEKKRQIAALISRFAINPQTRLPHPQERILTAMEQINISIDPFKPAEQQVDNVVKLLKSILPLSLEELTLIVEIPAKYTGRAYGILKEYNVHQDKWLNDGTLVARITIPAGLKENIYRRLGALCEGNLKIEEVKR